MATVDKMPMLAEGYERLQTEVRHLKMIERPSVIEAIEVARGHGDLSENAEYHAAKERQGQVEAQIADIEDRISRAMVIDPTTLSGDKVVFGATVSSAASLAEQRRDVKRGLRARGLNFAARTNSQIILLGRQYVGIESLMSRAAQTVRRPSLTSPARAQRPSPRADRLRSATPLCRPARAQRS